MTDSLVSAIVVNWNAARDLEVCLSSLLAQSYQPLEIIVVDNGSTDDSVHVVRALGVGWLPLDGNLGLAPAFNRGAKKAAGEFLLFLNNDMRFDANFVESMVSQIKQDPEIFSVDALQYDWDGCNKVHLATSIGKKPVGAHDDQLVPGLYICQEARDVPTTVLMSSGANMLVRKSMFTMLGGFDERLPMSYEDVELCWRAWIRRWKSIFVPAAVCWHRVGHSTQSTEGSRIRFRGTLRGRLLMATKLLPVNYAIATWWVFLAGLTKDLVCLRRQRVADRIEVLVQSILDLLPLLRERRELYTSGQVNPSEHLKRLLQLAHV
jgi:GT2 family glycosyltransferase